MDTTNNEVFKNTSLEMKSFGKFMELNWTITTIIGVVLNVLVVYLSCVIKDPEIKRYKWIIVYQSAIELLTSILLELLKMACSVYSDGLRMILLGFVVNFPIIVPTVVFTAYCCVVFINVSTVGLLFLYRQASICRKEWLLKLFKPAGVITLFAIFVVMSTANMIGYNSHVLYTKETAGKDSNFAGRLLLIMQFDFTQPVLVLFHVAVFLTMSVLSYIVVFGSCIAILRTIRESNVQTLRALQRKLTLVMTLQAMLPILVMVVPCFVYFALLAGNIVVGEYASFITVVMCYQPCIHPLLTVIFVKPYTAHLMAMIGCKKRRFMTKIVASLSSTRRGHGSLA